jgi:hypothetical protein
MASLEWTATQQEYRMLIATTENLPGHSVKEVKGQVFGVVVRSRGLAGNILAGLLALVVERWRYRQPPERPGEPWVGTDECFVDVETGKTMQVWYEARTGARRSVEAVPDGGRASDQAVS